MFVVGAVALFFFAPPSWWQFGVTPTEQRKSFGEFTLPRLEGGQNWKRGTWKMGETVEAPLAKNAL